MNERNVLLDLRVVCSAPFMGKCPTYVESTSTVNPGHECTVRLVCVVKR